MKLFDWQDFYSVGIKSIDEDHQQLLQIINELFEAVSHGKAKEHLSTTFDKLVHYIKVHFKREEDFFAQTNYPFYEEHKIQHDHFVEKINSLQKGFQEENQKITLDLMKFLTDWLVNHILYSDKKYSEHLKNYDIL